MPLHLISGGARSGKSHFAHLLALKLGQRRIFLATAQAHDDEMQSRIQLHQAERGAAYQTIEAPLFIAEALETCDKVDVILIDCLTLWLTNLLLADFTEKQIFSCLELGLSAAQGRSQDVIVVSNEVGFGIVPDNALARRFRDLNGRAQQNLAAQAQTLYVAFMGRILPLHTLGLTAEKVLV